MAQIDLLLAAELLVALLLLATLDCAPSSVTTAEPQSDQASPAAPWTAETDPHAQRILRLERGGGTAPLV